MCSAHTSSQINLPTIQVESDLSSLSNQSDSDIKENTESIDSQVSSEISKNSPDATSAEQTPAVEDEQQTDAEMLQEDEIVDGSNDSGEGIDAESKRSPLSEDQARTGQSDEGEGLVPVSHFPEDTDSAVDLKYCITHQLDPTSDISDAEVGEEAISLLASDTDTEQNLKYDSEPDQVIKDIKHEILQNCKIIAETPNSRRNDNRANEK
ncbi:uncharacterized protein LOC132117014 isoform X2 [Carassius carassius]|uniref:uncharacterized protein LOC132117014 isoform X2 n=1 Tax=Carassius carassius TaxID=217509 RepID=UPI002868D0CC|nr:uncharacterized protein LOC132117014 isoform X2 [Carassius carassius]